MKMQGGCNCIIFTFIRNDAKQLKCETCSVIQREVFFL
jgi:hypothetical protein